jgi:hypothetical protein
MNSELFLRIENFYCRLQAGEYDHPYDLAVALELLANGAWDEVDELYQSALRIE